MPPYLCSGARDAAQIFLRTFGRQKHAGGAQFEEQNRVGDLSSKIVGRDR
jgi:hypothetical protein